MVQYLVEKTNCDISEYTRVLPCFYTHSCSGATDNVGKTLLDFATLKGHIDYLKSYYNNVSSL